MEDLAYCPRSTTCDCTECFHYGVHEHDPLNCAGVVYEDYTCPGCVKVKDDKEG